jgi:hypothetical protein
VGPVPADSGRPGGLWRHLRRAHLAPDQALRTV